MRAKLTYLVTALVLVFYFVLVGSRGLLLIEQGTLLTVTFGVAVLILPVIGLWFLWANTQFVRKANRLAELLEAEGGLPVDELRRDQYGRIDRDSADEVFARRKAETEDTPGTGAAGSASPWPTATPGTPRAPARRCSAPSPSRRAGRSARTVRPEYAEGPRR